MTMDEERDRRLSALLGIMTVLGGTASINEILFAVSTEVVSATGATACNSFLMTDGNGNFYYRIVGPDQPQDWTVPDPPDALAVEVLETGLPIAVSDCANDPRCDAVSRQRFGIKSALVFPLLHGGKVLAAACCIFMEPHQFTEEEIAVVMAIAGVGAMAVSHANIDEENLRLAVAEERNRLSQELHDSLCQSLAATKIQLSLLMREPGVPEGVKSRAREAIDLVEGAYADARDIVHAFRAAGSVGEDFPTAFEAYVRDFSTRTGIQVIWKVRETDLRDLAPDAMLQISRVLGEALSNVRKHARASTVALASTTDGAYTTITVEDDGIGFKAKEAQGESNGHFGLKVMAERATLAHGTFALEEVSPHGTRVVLRVPRRSR